jgi:hypothetical protein
MATTFAPSLNRLDLEREEKRVRSILKTAEGLQALRNGLGYNFVLAKEARETKKPIVAVLSPSRNGFKPETHRAFQAMVEASQSQAVIYPEPAVSASIVHWVRNDLFCRLYKSGKAFDYCLLMDDDMEPEPQALNKLLAHDKEIVAAGCTVRSDPPRPNFRTWDPETFTFRTAFQWNGEGLVRTGAIGTGFMLVKREAMEKIANYYLSLQHEKRFLLSPFTVGDDGKFHYEKFDEKRLPAWLQQNLKTIEDLRWKAMTELDDDQHPRFDSWWFECLKQPNHSGEYGEDLSFCFKAIQLGIEIYVDTTVRVGHLGTYAYSLADFKDYQDGLIKEETHRDMLRAVTGKPVYVPSLIQPQTQTKTISVIAPTRGRWPMMQASITSLLSKAAHPENIEILIRYDDDETCTLEPHERVTAIAGPRHAYRGLHHYYNELAAKATGDWIFCWSDDALMESDAWDEKIHTLGGGLKILKPDTGFLNQLNLFPIISRPLYETMGHISLQTHGDSWLQAVARVNGIEEPVEIKVHHLREDIDDLTKQTSLGTYRESQPEFFSREFQELLYQDVIKVKERLMCASAT